MEGNSTSHRFLRFGIFVALLAILVAYYYLRLYSTYGLWPFENSEKNVASSIFAVIVGVFLAVVYSAFHLFGKKGPLREK